MTALQERLEHFWWISEKKLQNICDSGLKFQIDISQCSEQVERTDFGRERVLGWKFRFILLLPRFIATNRSKFSSVADYICTRLNALCLVLNVQKVLAVRN